MAQDSLEGCTGIPVRVCLTSQDGSVPSSRVAGPSAACVCLRVHPQLDISCMYTATHALAYVQQCTCIHAQLCALLHMPKHFAYICMSTCKLHMTGYMVECNSGPNSLPLPAFHSLPCDFAALPTEESRIYFPAP